MAIITNGSHISLLEVRSNYLTHSFNFLSKTRDFSKPIALLFYQKFVTSLSAFLPFLWLL